MVKVVYGNLLDSSAKYICHQVNCKGVMGSGVAKQIKEKWPSVFRRYKEKCDMHGGNVDELLGTAQGVRVDGYTVVVNIFGQVVDGRSGGPYTDMGALKSAFTAIASHSAPGDTIAMPYRIGCGLGGGDWGKVMDLLTECFKDRHLTLYKLS